MNVVEYALRDYYKQKLNDFYNTDITMQELREDLMLHGCISAKQTVLSAKSNGGPGDHIWTVVSLNKRLLYRINTRVKERKIELIEVR